MRDILIIYMQLIGYKYFSSTVPPPLNLENVTTVVEKLPYDMWKEWDKGNRAPRTGVRSIHYSPSFRLELGLSEKQCIAIKLNERFSFLGDRIRAGMMWWLQYHPQASWRKLICAIDAVTPVEQRFWEFDLRKLADEIRGYAEPVKGQSQMCCKGFSRRKKDVSHNSYMDTI